MNNTDQHPSDPAAAAEADAAPVAETVADPGAEPALDPTRIDPLADPRVAELEAELAEMKDRWMRAEAETQNVRTRSRREIEDARQYAVQKFAADVAEAAENLRRGIASMPAAGAHELVDKLREGFEGVERSFLGILERNGIKGEDPTGALFDPNLHQAMAEQESDAHPPGTVMQAWTQAWTLHGRLLKPAMVVVAKAPPTAIPPAAG